MTKNLKVAIIEKAIQNMKTISFSYEDSSRIVEPYALGYHKTTGGTLLRAYQVDGTSSSGNPVGWKLFDVEKMGEVGIEEHSFEPRKEYKRFDKAMKEIIAQV